MFEIPSNPKIVKCLITKETIESGAKPIITIDENRVIETNHIIERKSTDKKEETA